MIYARDAFAGAALLGILVCVTSYDRSTRYPGLLALVPCFATAILLATAETSVVGRWLSAKPLAFTGLISYSLYLWHLPVLAFAGYYYVRPLQGRHLVILLPLIYVLSAASWRYVEAPVRGRTLLAANSRFLAAIGGATLTIGLVGLMLWQSQGLPGRLSEADKRLFSNPDRLRQDAINCASRSLSAIANGSLCHFGPGVDATADVVVWGDSHALALLPAYERIATARGVRVHIVAASACRPLLDAGSETTQFTRRQNCSDFNRAAVSAVEAIDPALVILNAFWTYPDLAIVATNGGEPARGPPPFQLAFERTLRAIDSDRRKICVIGQVPVLDYVMPYAYAIARRRGIDPGFIAVPGSEAERERWELEGHFQELQRRHSFLLVDPAQALCSGPTCALVTADGKSIYRDNNHLSVAGALVLESSLEACFDGMADALSRRSRVKTAN